jgi:hypothetical protein
VQKPTDEEVARDVLKRAGGGSLAEREKRVPVSRELLRKWDGGDYSMQPSKKTMLIAWLEGEQERGPSYLDGVREAITRVERVLTDLRKIVTPPTRRSPESNADARARAAEVGDARDKVDAPAQPTEGGEHGSEESA